MKQFFKKHTALWSQKSFCLHIVLGLFLIAMSLVMNSLANSYTVSHASNSVTDIILDNIPTINVDPIYSEGAMLFILFIACVLLYEPKHAPFTLKAIALFVGIRSLFLILTHLAPPAHQSYVDITDMISKLSSGDDMFFSSHTGLPFLLALVFWNNKFLKYSFLAATAIGGTAVLLGHLHYSIDVFSAFFISYGTFHIAKKFFANDYKAFGKDGEWRTAIPASAQNHVVG